MTTLVRKATLFGWGSLPAVQAMVEIEIDDELLISHLGEKAWRNKSKKSAMQGRMIKATVRPVSSET
jgi:hypothetical protein